MLYGLQMDIVTDHLNKNDKKNTVEAILSDWRDTGAGNYHNRIFGPFLGDDDDGDDEFPLVTQFTRCLFRGKAKAFPKL